MPNQTNSSPERFSDGRESSKSSAKATPSFGNPGELLQHGVEKGVFAKG